MAFGQGIESAGSMEKWLRCANEQLQILRPMAPQCGFVGMGVPIHGNERPVSCVSFGIPFPFLE
jgi:hypothetical protein